MPLAKMYFNALEDEVKLLAITPAESSLMSKRTLLSVQVVSDWLVVTVI